MYFPTAPSIGRTYEPHPALTTSFDKSLAINEVVRDEVHKTSSLMQPGFLAAPFASFTIVLDVKSGAYKYCADVLG